MSMSGNGNRQGIGAHFATFIQDVSLIKKKLYLENCKRLAVLVIQGVRYLIKIDD
uniref:Uncharacterized protein n=1 Tax=Rhizophagus irregularis (strain DAOM 181602 / DAOM 197198 / MUCL 43194) TaxID=747089 RepID=U9U8T5_RHIID